MVPAIKQKNAIKTSAVGHADGLVKAGNAECDFLLNCPQGCFTSKVYAALQILAGQAALLWFAPCIYI